MTTEALRLCFFLLDAFEIVHSSEMVDQRPTKDLFAHSSEMADRRPAKDLLHLLKSEQARLSTFHNWEKYSGCDKNTPSPIELARAGFFYFDDKDHVQCAFCLGIVGAWEKFDTALGEHAKFFPSCPFVLGFPVGNIPMERINGVQFQSAARMDFRPNAIPEQGISFFIFFFHLALL